MDLCRRSEFLVMKITAKIRLLELLRLRLGNLGGTNISDYSVSENDYQVLGLLVYHSIRQDAEYQGHSKNEIDKGHNVQGQDFKISR